MWDWAPIYPVFRYRYGRMHCACSPVHLYIYFQASFTKTFLSFICISTAYSPYYTQHSCPASSHSFCIAPVGFGRATRPGTVRANLFRLFNTQKLDAACTPPIADSLLLSSSPVVIKLPPGKINSIEKISVWVCRGGYFLLPNRE
jgi:hypothetical protein